MLLVRKESLNRSNYTAEGTACKNIVTRVAQLNSELRGRFQPCTNNISRSDSGGIVENEGEKSKKHEERGRREPTQFTSIHGRAEQKLSVAIIATNYSLKRAVTPSRRGTMI